MPLRCCPGLERIAPPLLLLVTGSILNVGGCVSIDDYRAAKRDAEGLTLQLQVEQRRDQELETHDMPICMEASRGPFAPLLFMLLATTAVLISLIPPSHKEGCTDAETLKESFAREVNVDFEQSGSGYETRRDSASGFTIVMVLPSSRMSP